MGWVVGSGIDYKEIYVFSGTTQGRKVHYCNFAKFKMSLTTNHNWFFGSTILIA